MSVLYIALPVALVFSGVFVMAFIWATRQGQFDDLDTPARRILNDEVNAKVGEESQSQTDAADLEAEQNQES